MFWAIFGLNILTLSAVNSAGQCPAHWTLIGETCWNITTNAGSWETGKQFCKNQGGKLANIESAETQASLAKVLSAYENAHMLSLHTPNQYRYHYLHDQGVDVTKTTFVTFTVQACNDAHVALSNIKGQDTKDTYEIVIGGWADSESVIRDCKQCAHMAEVRNQNHPVSCTEARPFWISWSNNNIRVGKGNVVGEQQFMAWKDPSPHPVNYIAVSTGFGSTGQWHFNKKTSVPDEVWVGATDFQTENEWVWMPSETPVSSYTNWFPGQPDNLNRNQHCIALDPSSGMKWRDENCVESKHFLCEKQAVMSSVVG